MKPIANAVFINESGVGRRASMRVAASGRLIVNGTIGGGGGVPDPGTDAFHVTGSVYPLVDTGVKGAVLSDNGLITSNGKFIQFPAGGSQNAQVKAVFPADVGTGQFYLVPPAESVPANGWTVQADFTMDPMTNPQYECILSGYLNFGASAIAFAMLTDHPGGVHGGLGIVFNNSFSVGSSSNVYTRDGTTVYRAIVSLVGTSLSYQILDITNGSVVIGSGLYNGGLANTFGMGTQSGTLQIGAFQDGLTESWNGSIGNIRIYAGAPN